MGLTGPLSGSTSQIPFVKSEAITDTNVHRYYGLGLTSLNPYNVSGFRVLAVNAYNTHNQIATVTIYGRIRGNPVSGYYQIGDPITLVATSGEETRVLNLDESYFEEIYLELQYASSPSSGTITLMVYGVSR